MIIDAIGFVYDEYVKMVNHPHSQSELGNL